MPRRSRFNIRHLIPSRMALYVAAGIVLLYAVFYCELRQKTFSHEPHDSFTLQSQAWWEGHADLKQDYSYLELAKFNDKIYVSFPPGPSFVQFFLVPIFGLDTPNNLLTTLCFVVAFFLLWQAGQNLFWAAFAVFASGAFPISFSGGVWFQAQALCFFWVSLALYVFLKNRSHRAMLTLFFMAMAVSCRPHLALLIPFFLFEFRKILRARDLAPAALVAIALSTYNFVRFGNPIEFGHNYLPEFTKAQHGQFSLFYIPQNLWHCIRFPWVKGLHGVETQRFDGSNVFLIFPILLSLILGIWKDFRSKSRALFTPSQWILYAGLGMATVFLLSHRTLGGWHFGNRYFVDLLPFVWLILVTSKTKRSRVLQRSDLIFFFVGILVNWVGAFVFYREAI